MSKTVTNIIVAGTQSDSTFIDFALSLADWCKNNLPDTSSVSVDLRNNFQEVVSASIGVQLKPKAWVEIRMQFTSEEDLNFFKITFQSEYKKYLMAENIYVTENS